MGATTMHDQHRPHRTRHALIVVTPFVLIITVALAALTSSNHHRNPAPRANIVRTLTTGSATAPTPSPSPTFDPDAVLNILTQMDPNLADRLINAMSPSDRAALAIDVTDRTAYRPAG
jgi:hypothetical protein